MKNMNVNKFMMLLVLAVGSASQVRAYNHHDHNACPTHDEHNDIKRIEKRVHELRKDILDHGAMPATYKELAMLKEEAKNLCASCHAEHHNMCKTHEHTLVRKIDNAQKLADKHHAEKKAKAHKKHDDVKVQSMKNTTDNAAPKPAKAKKAKAAKSAHKSHNKHDKNGSK